MAGKWEQKKKTLAAYKVEVFVLFLIKFPNHGKCIFIKTCLRFSWVIKNL